MRTHRRTSVALILSTFVVGGALAIPAASTALAPHGSGSSVNLVKPAVATPSMSVAPTLDMNGNLIPGSVDLTFAFTDQADITGAWVDWGDGDIGGLGYQASGASIISHQYAQPGTHTITLSARDTLSQITTFYSLSFEAALGTRIDGPVRSYDSRKTVHVPAHGIVALSSTQLEPYVANTAPPISAVVGITVTNAQQAGYITAYPGATTRPTASSLNFAAGQTVANEADVRFGTDGNVDFYNGSAGTIDLIVDTYADQSMGGRVSIKDTDSFSTPNSYVPMTPIRVLDTRSGLGAGGSAVVVAGHSFQKVSLDGVAGIPNDYTGAVLLNVATANTSGSGWLGLSDDGQAVPTTSASNWSAGQTVSNLVLAQVLNGATYLYNGGANAVSFIADASGYYAAWGTGNAGYFLPTAPTRLLDTRKTAKIGPRQTILLQVTNAPNTSAAALNLTALDSGGVGYLTLFADGNHLPIASNVNYTAGNVTANASITPLASDGTVEIYNGGSTTVDVIVDLNGTYVTYPTS